MNPETELTNGRLELLQNRILSSSQITPSPQTDGPSSTISTRSRSSTPNARGMGMKKKSEDQGYLIVANRGGAQHAGSGGDVDGIHRWFMIWG